MRPVARMPKLTRRSRILIGIALAVIALLLIGPRLIDTYVDWTLEHVRANPDFTWTATGPDDWRLPWANWPGTRYEAKARREWRVSAYLTFVRRPRG